MKQVRRTKPLKVGGKLKLRYAAQVAALPPTERSAKAASAVLGGRRWLVRHANDSLKKAIAKISPLRPKRREGFEEVKSANTDNGREEERIGAPTDRPTDRPTLVQFFFLRK